MKSSFFACLLILSCLVTRAAFGQSSFELANKHSPLVDAPVFDAQGVPLAGSGYLAEFWGGATTGSLAPLVLFPQGGREIVPFLSGGYFIPTAASGNLVVPAVPPGGLAWLQLRAWDARLGATYEETSTRGLGGYGESPLFFAQGGIPFDLLGVPAPLIGLQSFSLLPVVPEPSAVWLFLLGAPFVCSFAAIQVNTGSTAKDP